MLSGARSLPEADSMSTSSYPASFDAWAVVETCALERSSNFVGDLAVLVGTALRLVPPERTVLVTLEQDSPWVDPVRRTYPTITHVTLPLDRGSGLGLAAGALYLCRRVRAPHGWFLTGPVEHNAYAVGRLHRFASRDLVRVNPAELPVRAYAGGAQQLIAALARVAPEPVGPLLSAHLGELSMQVPRLPYFDLGDALDHLPHFSLRSSAPHVCHDDVRVSPSF